MVTIITVSYNSHGILNECLAPLLENGNYPTIIIDNASTDGSAEALKKKFPNLQIKALQQNIGYGRAANVGLRVVETPYALLINPDIKLIPDQINKLLQYARADISNTAIWGPASQQTDYCEASPESVEWISGCAMLFDMRKLEEIGLFDDNFFLFFEETDLCRRTIKAGFQIKLCKDVFFDHQLGQASGTSAKIEAIKAWHYGWSRCYYYSNHEPDNRKRHPHKQYSEYLRKSLISISHSKRLKYRHQAAGAKAFINGENAFLEDGTPQKFTN